MSTIAWPRKVLICAGLFLALGCLFAVVDVTAQIETISPELLREASRRTGLSEEELLRRYAEAQQERADSGLAPGTIDSTYSAEPGRTDLRGIDDRIPGGVKSEVGRGDSESWRDQREVFLSMQNQLVDPMSSAQIDSVLRLLTAQTDSIPFFGASFFKLDAGVFSPPSFGPVPEDYVVGIGDEIVIDVWGEVELRVARIVDRDGAIILPKVGKIPVQNRRLDEVKETIREKLASVHSGISLEPGEGDIFIDVSLGILRGIRIFVVGETVQPGSYELSSVATVFTALYAAGGPTSNGSMRDVRLVRDNEVIASLDVYDYLLGGRRLGDSLLRDGDTVFMLSGHGKLLALAIADGSTRWEIDLEETFGTGQAEYGFATSPVVIDGVVVLDVGGPEEKSHAGLDRDTGEVKWANGKTGVFGTGYSSVLPAAIDGQIHLVHLAGLTLRAVDAPGNELWSTEWPRGETHAMPTFIPPDMLFASGAGAVGSTVVRVDKNGDGFTTEEVWKSPLMRNHFSSTLYHDGYLYGFDNATLKCLDAMTGEQKWAKRGFGKGALILADGNLIVLSDRGRLALVEATSETYREKGSVQALTGKSWTAPSLADGRLYLRNHTEKVAYDVTSQGD